MHSNQQRFVGALGCDANYKVGSNNRCGTPPGNELEVTWSSGGAADNRVLDGSGRTYLGDTKGCHMQNLHHRISAIHRSLQLRQRVVRLMSQR